MPTRALAKALPSSFSTQLGYSNYGGLSEGVQYSSRNNCLVNISLSLFCLTILLLKKACFMNEQMLSLTWYRFFFLIVNACFWQLCLSFEGNKGIIIQLSCITNCWTWGINGVLCCHHSLIATAAALCSCLAVVHEKGGCRSLSFMLRVIYRCRNNSRLC